MTKRITPADVQWWADVIEGDSTGVAYALRRLAAQMEADERDQMQLRKALENLRVAALVELDIDDDDSSPEAEQASRDFREAIGVAYRLARGQTDNPAATGGDTDD